MKTIQQAVAEIEALEEIMIGDDTVEKILEGVPEDDYEIVEAGSFDSPGYDMNSYALAYLEDGKIKMIAWEEVMY